LEAYGGGLETEMKVKKKRAPNFRCHRKKSRLGIRGRGGGGQQREKNTWGVLQIKFEGGDK